MFKLVSALVLALGLATVSAPTTASADTAVTVCGQIYYQNLRLGSDGWHMRSNNGLDYMLMGAGITFQAGTNCVVAYVRQGVEGRVLEVLSFGSSNPPVPPSGGYLAGRTFTGYGDCGLAEAWPVSLTGYREGNYCQITMKFSGNTVQYIIRDEIFTGRYFIQGSRVFFDFGRIPTYDGYVTGNLYGRTLSMSWFNLSM